MVTIYGKSFLLQLLTHILHYFPGQAVNNTAVLPVVLQIIDNGTIPVTNRFHTKIQIFPVKSRGQSLRVPQLQNLLYIFPDLGSSRSGKCTDHRTFRKLLHKFCDFQITGPEILSPLGYTVGLVHRHHGDLHMTGKIQKFRAQ